MRDIPAGLTLDPMPSGFTAHIVVSPDGRLLKWSAQVSTPQGPLRVEYGLPVRDGGPKTITDAIASITATAWQTTELARIGRQDLLAYVRTDRHTKRPGKGRALSDEATQLLANVKAAHEERLAREAQQ